MKSLEETLLNPTLKDVLLRFERDTSFTITNLSHDTRKSYPNLLKIKKILENNGLVTTKRLGRDVLIMPTENGLIVAKKVRELIKVIR